MNEIKAKVATVKFGHIEIEGLQATDGSYGISVSQIARLVSVTQNHVKRDLTQALGAKIPFTKLKTDLNSRFVWVLNSTDLVEVLKFYDNKGNKKATDLLKQLAGLSIKILFDDAFGVENTKEDRQDFLKALQVSKNLHRELVWAGNKHLGWKTQHDRSAGIGEFNLRFKGKTSLGSKETMSESELERFNRQATLTVMYIKSGYDLQEALNKVFN